jgi:hypothetical protein
MRVGVPPRSRELRDDELPTGIGFVEHQDSGEHGKDTRAGATVRCGVAPGHDRHIVRGVSARRTSASWCSSMAASTCGTRPAPRAAA